MSNPLEFDNWNKQNLNITTLPYQLEQYCPSLDLEIPSSKNIKLTWRTKSIWSFNLKKKSFSNTPNK